MALQDGTGNILNKTEFLALTTAVPQPEAKYRLTAPIYETYSLSGESNHQSGKRKLHKTGDVLTQSQIDAMFAAGTVTTVAPTTGGVAGGTAVTIMGTNLSGVEGVTFGGTAATAVKVVSDTKVTCVAPAHAAGAVSVVVKDDAGDITKTNAYTYA